MTFCHIKTSFTFTFTCWIHSTDYQATLWRLLVPLGFTFRQGSNTERCVYVLLIYFFPFKQTYSSAPQNHLICTIEVTSGYTQNWPKLHYYQVPTQSTHWGNNGDAFYILNSSVYHSRARRHIFPSTALSHLLCVLSAHVISANANFSGFTFTFK